MLIALLGRRSTPTDGIEDYCTFLGKAFAEKGLSLAQVRFPWQELGWPRALRWLWSESARWDGRWIVVQYTALSWSRRGLPFWLLALLAMLRCRSSRVAVFFHDASGAPGRRLIDGVRRACQHWTMRMAYRLANRSIHNVPVDRVGWLPPARAKAVCIPIGSNVPAMNHKRDQTEARKHAKKTVAVFCVTEGEHSRREVQDIAYAVLQAARRVPSVRLVVVGRGSREADGLLRQALNGVNTELRVLGLLPAEHVSRMLGEADAMLFVRGPLSGQRGSGIAGIACGCPIVGYAGQHTGPPVTEAGVSLVPYGDREALGIALTRVLSDRSLWQNLHERSIRAYEQYFSWGAIARKFVEALRS